MPEKRPTWEWVKRKLEDRRSLYATLRAAYDEDDAYHTWSDEFAKNTARPYLNGLPDGFEPVLMPWAHIAVQVGVNRIIAGEEPDVFVKFPAGSFNSYPKEKREEAERERRDLYVKWVRGGLRRVLGRATVNPAREMATKELALGVGILRWPVSSKAWQEPPFGRLKDGTPRPPGDSPAQQTEFERWERKRRDSWPWAIDSPPPKWVFWDPDEDPPRDFIIEEEVNASAVDDDEEALGTAKKTRVTYVSGDWIGQWCDERPLLKGRGIVDGVARNQGIRPWVVVAFSGMGSTDSEASWSSKVKGTIRDGHGIILSLTKAVNWLAAMAEQHAFPSQVVQGPGASGVKIEMGAAAVTRIESEDITLRPMEPPHTPAEVYRLFDQASAAYAAHFGADVLRGEFRSEPTGSLRTRAALAGAPFESPKVALEQAWSYALTDIVEQVKTVLREPVYAGGVTMRPQDVILGAEVTVDLTPLTEEERAFKRTAAQDDVKMGALTVEDYIRTQLGSDDPQRVMRQVAKERLREAILGSEAVIAMLTQQIVGAPPEAPMPEGEPGEAQAPEMQAPAPTLASPGDAEQYVGSVMGSPLVQQERAGVQSA